MNSVYDGRRYHAQQKRKRIHARSSAAYVAREEYIKQLERILELKKQIAEAEK